MTVSHPTPPSAAAPEAATADATLPFLTLSDAAAALARGAVGSLELTRLMLARIERLNPKLNIYISVHAEDALAEAAALDSLRSRGISLGPLHGVPIALKDNIATAGRRTTAASRLFADHVPEKDATVTARLRRAGTVMLGKLNLYELAFGGVHEDFGETLNPFDPSRACGASSSGPAAAVAAGLAYGTLGTDTGGSIRLPAAACGLTGHKPTYGVVSRAGVFPAGYSLDTVGPLCRSARDAALMMAALAGPDGDDPAGSQRPAPDYVGALTGDIRGLRVGVPTIQDTELCDPQMRAAADAAICVLEGLGATLIEINVPDHLWSRSVMWSLSAAELADAHRDFLASRADDYSPTVRGHILQGAFLPATEYVRAQRVRQKIALAYREIMTRVDVIAMPVVPFPAWPVGAATVTIDGVEEGLMPGLTRYCPPFNITGQPAVAVPCGFDDAGLPLSVQLAGRLHEDALVLKVADAYQRATDWHLRVAPLARIA